MELVDPRTGEAYDVPDADVARAQTQFGFVTPQNWTLQKKYGSGEEQAKAAAKLAANVASFGMAGFDAAADNDAIGVFREKSPTLAALTEVAGSVAPAAVGAGAAGLAMRAAGLGARAATLGTLAAEEITQSLAIERQQAAEEARGIDAVNVIQGLPLAFGLSAASRIARGARAGVSPLEAGRALGGGVREFGSSLSAGLRGAPAEGIEEAAESGANAVSRGRATSKARRSVGAAGTDGGRVPLTEKEVRFYGENAEDITRDVNKTIGDALDSSFGGQDPAFNAVHDVGLNRDDFVGRMGDADRIGMLDLADKQMTALDDAAKFFKENGQTQTARALNAHAEEIARVYTLVDESPEVMAEALNNAKRTLYRRRTAYGRSSDVVGRNMAEYLDALWPSLREGLEDQKIFGKAWGEAQQVENLKWAGDKKSGKRGLIDNMTVWQREFMQDTGIDNWVGHATKNEYVSRGDIAERLLAMNDKDYARTMKALRETLEDTTDKTLYRVESGRPSAGNTPVMRLQTDVNHAAAALDEIDNLRDAMGRGAKDIAAKAAAKRQAVGPLEKAFEIGKALPGIGSTLSKAQQLGYVDFDLPVAPPRPDLTREAAHANIRARLDKNKPKFNKPPPTEGGAIPRPGPDGRSPEKGMHWVQTAPAESVDEYIARQRRGERGSASLGAMAGAGAFAVGGLAAAPAITDALADLSEDNRAIRERAATGLIIKAARGRPLPGQLERFREGAPSLAAAYATKLDDLQQALNDPRALVTGIADAYGSVADHHEDLYVELVQRTAAAAEYVLANAPPSVGISVVNPDGVAPDTLALAQFAQLWSGAMNPGDVIYDVGTGSATPTQIKALREVHPDIYGALRNDVLKQVDRATMPFETLRQLDVLFDLPGISGPAFSPDMTKTMQAVWKQPANPSKSAASGAQAPASANAQFAAGPTRMR